MSLAIAVFASGGGTNLQSLLDYFGSARGAGSSGGGGVARVTLVVSDRPGAGAIERARRAGVETRVIRVRGRGAGEVAEETLTVLDRAGVDLVVLAGYLSLVPAEVVRAYRGRLLNIHPALLPSFGGQGMYGIHIHRAVIEAGCRVTGVTIHFVDERYDTGPILLQWPVPVLEGDTAEELAARVLRVEHRVLPLAVEYLAERIARGGVRRGGAGAEVGPGGAIDWEGEARFALTDDGVPTEEEVRRLLGAAGE